VFSGSDRSSPGSELRERLIEYGIPERRIMPRRETIQRDYLAADGLPVRKRPRPPASWLCIRPRIGRNWRFAISFSLRPIVLPASSIREVNIKTLAWSGGDCRKGASGHKRGHGGSRSLEQQSWRDLFNLLCRAREIHATHREWTGFYQTSLYARPWG
jgi:hypothetical protein